MKIADVAKLSPEERFIYWIKERHAIYERRQAGEPKPWTNDEVLQNYFFTNPYRENDKVTAWFRETIRNPLRNHRDVIFATVAFRWFNLPETGNRLWDLGLLRSWEPRDVLQLLCPLRDRGEKIFTGAFMINSPAGEPKLEAIVRRVSRVWEARSRLPYQSRSMEDYHRRLTEFDGLGGFMAYEVVCDLRWTKVLEAATDKLTWCNPGPGCIRGLYRIAGEEITNKSNSTSPPRPKDWLDRMKRLLGLVQKRLTAMPPFEMREIEHSLCEFDKYSRALAGDGRLKRRFQGT